MKKMTWIYYTSSYTDDKINLEEVMYLTESIRVFLENHKN
jgi:hypothetical protein